MEKSIKQVYIALATTKEEYCNCRIIGVFKTEQAAEKAYTMAKSNEKSTRRFVENS